MQVIHIIILNLVMIQDCILQPKFFIWKRKKMPRNKNKQYTAKTQNQILTG